MQNENLSIYLSDHFAGSVSALQLVDHLLESGISEDLKSFLQELRPQIQADQDTLKKLMENLGIHAGKLKNATAWFMEKAGRLKLHAIHENDVGLLLSLEGLLLGIEGKKALWRSLPVISGGVPLFGGIGFARLEERAGAQARAVDLRRIEVAQKVLGSYAVI